mgnify:CR=1 FL=1
MNKPQLIYTNPIGATVHSYELTGGQTTFQRYLACFLGHCTFYNTLKEAKHGIDYRMS